jgi:hypothetical protein
MSSQAVSDVRRISALSGLLFSALLVSAFALVFGPSVMAQFMRQDGPSGWGYGYGYGYGVGYGWDEGTFAGYATVMDGGSIEYTVTNIVYDPYDVSGGATLIPEISDCISCVSSGITLPFDFTFYGNTYDTIYASNNGFISFNSDTEDGCCGTQIPGFSTPVDNLIAGAWTNLSPLEGGHVEYEVFGSEPNRVFVIEYDGVEVNAGDGNVTVQIHLHEDDTIEIHTASIDITGQLVTQGVLNIGATSGTATPGINYAFNYENALFAYRFESDEGSSGDPFVYGHGYGFGYGLEDHEDSSVIAYDPATDTYDVGFEGTESFGGEMLWSSALIIPVSDETDPNAAEQWYFNANVRVHTENGHIFTIPRYTVIDASDIIGGVVLSFFRVTIENDIEGIPDEVRGDVRFGSSANDDLIPSFNLNDEDESMSISFLVDEGLEGDDLDVWYFDGEDWILDAQTCEVDEGVCTITASSFTAYAVAGGTIGGGGSTTIAPYTTLSLPNGGQSLTAGQSYDILWNAAGTGLSQIRLSLSTDGGATFPTTITTLTSNPGTFRWTVPSVTTTTARIKIEALTASGSVLASDMSDADFSIASGTTGGDEDEEDTTPALPTFSDEVDGEPFDATASGSDARDREEADEDLPLICPADALVKLPSDNDPSTQSDSTVYYIGLDAKRHSFLNDVFYSSWYDSFGPVLVVDPATLASIPLGKPIMVRPGTFWVKAQNDPKTYYVAPNNVLRWIANETAALMLGGINWNQNVIDLDPSLFSHFTMGDVIDTMVLASGWPRGSLMKTSTSDTVWYVAEDTRRPFTSDAAFSSNRYQDRFIETSDAAGWTSLPLGTPIESQEDGLFSLQH